MTAIAISNNDIALIAWSIPDKIKNCLGFAIYRIEGAVETALPSWVGFADEPASADVQPTNIWPIQKFNWRDLTAKRGGTYKYRIVPVVQEGDKRVEKPGLGLVSNTVTLSPDRDDISVYFNRGILSTQALVRALPAGSGGSPNRAVLKDRIDQPGDPLRARLAGDLVSALKRLLDKAEAEDGSCYCALYELNDTELVQRLAGDKRVHLILSNSSTSDGVPDATNAGARQTLRDSNNVIFDRMLVSGHIGHNKFIVYLDKNKKPQEVLTGSTNWTSSGLCAQSNNALIIRSPALAAVYLDYWKRLKADDSDSAKPLRDANRTAIDPIALTAGDVRPWFSPNTALKTKPADPAAPVDLSEVAQIIRDAKHAILFLAFVPGSPSIMDEVRAAHLANPNLFVRGALTDVEQAEEYIDLYHREGGEPDARVIPALGIPDQFGFWEKELSKLGHAVIHDKIVVVDPFSDNCVVITGSHNLGYKASYANDENMLIIRGRRDVASAYTAHILDIYDHYRFRFVVQEQHRKGRLHQAWSGLVSSDTWQDKYFNEAHPAFRDRRFWKPE